MIPIETERKLSPFFHGVWCYSEETSNHPPRNEKGDIQYGHSSSCTHTFPHVLTH